MFLNNILEEFIYPIYTYLTIEYEKKKNKIHESFKKTISYMAFFILLYLFKDFIFLLISKFDKLLRNYI